MPGGPEGVRGGIWRTRGTMGWGRRRGEGMDSISNDNDARSIVLYAWGFYGGLINGIRGNIKYMDIVILFFCE